MLKLVTCMFFSCVLHRKVSGVIIDLIRLVQQAGTCSTYIHTMISAVSMYYVQIKVGCDTLVSRVDHDTGWIIHHIVSVISMMNELYSCRVHEQSNKYVCLACDAVHFNWVFVVIDDFYWSCVGKEI